MFISHPLLGWPTWSALWYWFWSDSPCPFRLHRQSQPVCSICTVWALWTRLGTADTSSPLYQEQTYQDILDNKSANLSESCTAQGSIRVTNLSRQRQQVSRSFLLPGVEWLQLLRLSIISRRSIRRLRVSVTFLSGWASLWKIRRPEIWLCP